ncbi:MAG TPA: invasion associated locus B family protein [Pseudolabrys sp.]|nr:invasion associated locus B family protein [Pseudolabrys sp.]
MNISALFRTFVALLIATAFCTVASAQQKKAASPADKKAAPPADKKASGPADKKTSSPTDQAVLLGQFGEWGAYKALPGGKKICFALSKPTSSTIEPTGRTRDPAYAFVSTRPSEKVKNEVSVIVGYPQKPGQDATAAVGAATYAMYTQNDGAWVKNAAEEAQMVETMRKGADFVVKSESARGTRTTDTFSLKGIAQALDKVADECR